jgi:NAD(P)-dependent dehydrogenase (short-subunit alcohol dehydrogenase family)
MAALEGKTCIVTGGAGSLGLVTARLFVEEGERVMLVDLATEMFNQMIPLGRHAAPDEIARSVLYLAAPQSSFTTGAMLMVDGGMSV